MKEIKLVIWDLDETFWGGTLSEGGIIPNSNNIGLVKELTSRGIINSICSKNNFDEARLQLVDMGVWDYFVFPSISWQPKGLLVKEIIDQCQLRAENVLFLDDNHLNLEEVKYYNEGIRAENPGYIYSIKESSGLAGKDDRAHSRLKQYKLLENKSEERKKYSSNYEFLRDSKIRLQIIRDLGPVKERIYELINRTNQLNFTKIRLSEAELDELIAQDHPGQFAIGVADRFGEYGIVGFVSFDRERCRLNHFLFSCRILNLGVEQYMYQKLNYPELDVNGDVAVGLKHQEIVDWIEEAELPGQIPENGSRTEIRNKTNPRLLFIGSCDLDSSLHYLKGYSDYITKHMVAGGSYQLLEFPDHILTLLNKFELKGTGHLDDIASLPFFSKGHSLSDSVFRKNYDVLIYGVIANYGQNVYRHKKHGYLVPWGLYDEVLTETGPDSKILQKLRENGLPDPEGFLKKFSNEFEHLGLMSPQDFVESLHIFRKIIPDHIPIIFINGSEINPDERKEPGAAERHKIMNRALDDYLEMAENCYVIDIRKHVHSLEDMGETIRHFERQVYKKISDDLLELLTSRLNSKIKNKALLRFHYYKMMVVKTFVKNDVLNNRVTRGFYRTFKRLSGSQ